MADDFVAVPPDSSGKKIDCSKLTVNSVDVERQRAAIGDNTDPLAIAKVTNAQPAAGDYGVATRPIPGAPQGVTFDTTHANPLSEIAIAFNAGGDNPIINGVGGKVIKIWKLWVWVGGSCTLTFKDQNAALAGGCPCEQGAEFIFPRDSDPWFTCGIGNAFQINIDQAVAIGGRAYYTQA